MPLNKNYFSMIEGNISDLKNLGTGASGAGSITAALFLQEFVGNMDGQGDTSAGVDGGEVLEETKKAESRPIPWAHIDMAGPVWDSKRHHATGYGVKLLSHFLLSMSK